MFTGIVGDLGTLLRVADRGGVRRMSIACGFDPATLAAGGSVAVNGVCLTIAAHAETADGATFDVDAGPETLAVTTVGAWAVGARLNLERALRVGDELGGHLISGHVDGVSAIVARDDLGESVRFTFEAPDALARFIAPKGSVALDGTSLTVNNMAGSRFDCLIIPHTLAVTTWGDRRVGDRVNIEVDMIARYVARLAEAG